MTFLQRFGSALNLHLHYHVLVADGVWVERDDTVQFHALPPPTPSDIDAVAEATWRRVDRQLARRCLNLDDPDALHALSADQPLLAACYAASIRQRAALGARAGMPVWRLGVPVEPVEMAHRPAHGFSVHAGVGMGPRVHQIVYHGCWAPNAKLRPQVVACATVTPRGDACEHGRDDTSRRRLGWAKLLARVFAVDVLACPRCQGRMQRIAAITTSEAIRALLRSVGLPTAPPAIAPGRNKQAELDFDFAATP